VRGADEIVSRAVASDEGSAPSINSQFTANVCNKFTYFVSAPGHHDGRDFLHLGLQPPDAEPQPASRGS